MPLPFKKNREISAINGMTAYTIFSIKVLYVATLCLNRTLSCVDLVDVIKGDIPPGQAGPAPPPPPQCRPARQ